MPSPKLEKTKEYGTSKLLAYPEILHIDKLPEIIGQSVHLIKPYKLEGISVFLERVDGGTVIQFGDWDKKILDPSGAKYRWYVEEFLKKYGPQAQQLLGLIGLQRMQLYLTISNSKSEPFTLVDARIALDKFMSPLMMKDLFSKIMPIQSFARDSHITLDKSSISDLKKEKFIIKTTSFKTIIRGNAAHPLYAHT